MQDKAKLMNERLRHKVAKIQAGQAWRIELAEQMMREVGLTPTTNENGDTVWTIRAHDALLPLIARRCNSEGGSYVTQASRNSDVNSVSPAPPPHNNSRKRL